MGEAAGAQFLTNNEIIARRAQRQVQQFPYELM